MLLELEMLGQFGFVAKGQVAQETSVISLSFGRLQAVESVLGANKFFFFFYGKFHWIDHLGGAPCLLCRERGHAQRRAFEGPRGIFFGEYGDLLG